MSPDPEFELLYCKAFPTTAFAAFADWSPRGAAGAIADIVFLHGDYTVRAGPDSADPLVFRDDSPAWKDFCRDELDFRPDAGLKPEVPEDTL